MEYLFSQIQQPITQDFVDSNVDDLGHDSGMEDEIERDLTLP